MQSEVLNKQVIDSFLNAQEQFSSLSSHDQTFFLYHIQTWGKICSPSYKNSSQN